jgi:flagellar hook-length control protein FliK
MIRAEQPAPGSAITVPTAGAARATEPGADTSKTTAAQALARTLAAGSAERADNAQAITAQTNRDGGAQQPAGKPPARNLPSSSGEKPGAAVRAQRGSFAELVRLVRLNVGNRNSSATLRLDPPELGRMKVDVRMSDDALRLRIEVGNSQARELLSERVEQLAAALRAHDIRMERVEIVTVNQPDGEGRLGAQHDTRHPGGQSGEQPSAARSGNAGEETTDGRVGSEPEKITENLNFAQLDVSI